DIITKKDFDDITINCSEIFYGTVHSNFTYQITNSNPDLISCEIVQDSIVKISKKLSQKYGSAEITLSAKDTKWGETSTSFTFNVSDITNSAPIIIDSTKTRTLALGFEKTTIDISQLFTDENNDELVYSVSSSNTEIINPVITNSSNLEIIELKS